MKRIFLAFTLVLSLIFTSQPVMAAELENDIPSSSEAMIPLEETEYTREEALEILGLTEEEAKDMSFYVVDAEPAEVSDTESEISTHQVTIGPGESYWFPTFTFTGTNVGSYWTCTGTQLSWAAIYHSAASSRASIAIFLYGYGRENPDNVFEGCTSHLLDLMPGNSYTNGYHSAVKNYDYHFVYYGGDQSKITMIVGVK